MRLFAIAALAAFLPASARQEDDVLNEYEIIIKADHWKGFKEGSWVHRKISKRDSGGKKVAEYKITLAFIADNGYAFKVETLDEGKVIGTKMLVKQFFGDPTAVYEAEKKEDVKIGDKTFKCFVQEYKTEGDNATLQRTLECKEAPGITVLSLYESMYEGKKIVMKQMLTALSVEQAVGDKKVSCWKVEKTSDMPKVSITVLYSKDVPGGQVRRESSSEYGDYKTSAVDETVGFEAKK